MKKIFIVCLLISGCSLEQSHNLESGLECIEASAQLTKAVDFVKVYAYATEGITYEYKITLGDKKYLCAKQYRMQSK